VLEHRALRRPGTADFNTVDCLLAESIEPSDRDFKLGKESKDRKGFKRRLRVTGGVKRAA
jgi:hypothetical protein